MVLALLFIRETIINNEVNVQNMVASLKPHKLLDWTVLQFEANAKKLVHKRFEMDLISLGADLDLGSLSFIDLIFEIANLAFDHDAVEVEGIKVETNRLVLDTPLTEQLLNAQVETGEINSEKLSYHSSKSSFLIAQNKNYSTVFSTLQNLKFADHNFQVFELNFRYIFLDSMFMIDGLIHVGALNFISPIFGVKKLNLTLAGNEVEELPSIYIDGSLDEIEIATKDTYIGSMTGLDFTGAVNLTPEAGKLSVSGSMIATSEGYQSLNWKLSLPLAYLEVIVSQNVWLYLRYRKC